MKQLEYTLIGKKQLTHNVYELTFKSSEAIDIKAGQYIMFHLDSGLKRSYSVAFSDGSTFSFIIKQLENGAGSTEICSLGEGAVIKGLGPLGHFVLRETPMKKLFIGTGTGFAPLYFQVKKALVTGNVSDMRFIFGVRSSEDVFYRDELSQFRSQNSNFDYSIYLSQDEKEGFQKGYVTDFLTESNVQSFDEFYICGSPAMVKDARSKLESFGVAKEQIFFEQY